MLIGSCRGQSRARWRTFAGKGEEKRHSINIVGKEKGESAMMLFHVWKGEGNPLQTELFHYFHPDTDVGDHQKILDQ